MRRHKNLVSLRTRITQPAPPPPPQQPGACAGRRPRPGPERCDWPSSFPSSLLVLGAVNTRAVTECAGAGIGPAVPRSRGVSRRTPSGETGWLQFPGSAVCPARARGEAVQGGGRHRPPLPHVPLEAGLDARGSVKSRALLGRELLGGLRWRLGPGVSRRAPRPSRSRPRGGVGTSGAGPAGRFGPSVGVSVSNTSLDWGARGSVGSREGAWPQAARGSAAPPLLRLPVPRGCRGSVSEKRGPQTCFVRWWWS